MRKIIHILPACLIISICITSLAVGFNLAFRMPDIYSFTFKATPHTETTLSDYSAEELSDAIANYMQRQADNISFSTIEKADMIPLLSQEELTYLYYLRLIPDIFIILGFLALIFLVCISCFLLKNGHKEIIRKCTVIALLVHISFVCISTAALYFLSAKTSGLFTILGYTPEEGHILLQLMSEELLRNMYIASVGVSVPVMLIAVYILRALSTPKHMFKRV